MRFLQFLSAAIAVEVLNAFRRQRLMRGNTAATDSPLSSAQRLSASEVNAGPCRLHRDDAEEVLNAFRRQRLMRILCRPRGS